MGNFCGKCGSPIDVNTGVCPNCNVSIDAKAVPKKPLKLLKFVVPAVALVLIVCIISAIITNINLKISDEDKIIFANNMENASYATYDGKHLYYVVVGPSDDGNSHEYIYRMKLPVGKTKEIAEFSFFPEAMYVDGDTIHYENGFASGTISRKNGKNTYIDADGFNEENTIYFNDKCYYFRTEEEGYGIYIGEKFGEGKKVSDVVVTRAYPCGEYIYLFSSYSSYDNIENTNFGTWRMKLDGSELTQILDYCPEYFVSDGNKLYFKSKEHFLIISDLDGKNQERTSTQIGDGLNVKDGVIYFEDYAETGIYIMTESPLKDLVVSGDVTGIVLAGDYIVYYSNKNICVATIDGSNIKTISEIGSYSDHRF